MEAQLTVPDQTNSGTAAAQKQERLDRFKDRGFFVYDDSVEDTCLGLETPYDRVTGLPLPILPSEPLYPNSDTRLTDYHHHFHPRIKLIDPRNSIIGPNEKRLLKGDDGNIAVRMSRGQDLPRWQHEQYHKYFAGPGLPGTRADKFMTSLLACAGVIPDQAIKFTKQGPEIVTLGTDEQQLVAQSLRHEGAQRSDMGRFYRNCIGFFFANYTLEQSIDDVVTERVIDQFLSAPNDHRRKELGNLILSHAIDHSVEPVRVLHNEYRKNGLIVRRPTELTSIVTDYFTRDRRKDYISAIELKLMTGSHLPTGLMGVA